MTNKNMKIPDQNSYWVLPGRFLAGEYPGAEEDLVMRVRLRKFLDAGIRCFIDLTEPGEAGLKPYAVELKEEAERLGMAVDYIRFPLEDVKPPKTPQQMIDILNHIDRALEAEKPVYVHCWGGVGRTGTVVGCWLVRHGKTGAEAIEELKQYWQPVYKRTRKVNPKPVTPETPDQRDYVLNWREQTTVRTSASPDRASRLRGCLLGLAVGDAVGTTLEFKSPGNFKPINDMVGGGPFRLKPGQWTDDTSMALCLATSLVECKGFNAEDQMKRYVRWSKEGYLSSTGHCFDIGGTVSGALRRFQKIGDPIAGSTDPQTAGNGSLMRLAPVPMFFAEDASKAIEMAGESSRTTHGAPAAVDACRYMAGLIVGAINGAAKDQLMSAFYTPIPGYWDQHPLCPLIAEIAGGSFKRKQPPAIRGTGYVVQALEAALWAFHHTDNFRDAILKAVNLGDDADTTGAICGQLAGAFYGEQGIPEGWRDKLALKDQIDFLIEGIVERNETAQSS